MLRVSVNGKFSLKTLNNPSNFLSSEMSEVERTLEKISTVHPRNLGNQSL